MGGNFLGGLFGGGSTPEPVSYDPVPVREKEQEAESSAVRDEERRRLQARRSMSGTVLTSPLGTSGAQRGVLGRSGQQ